MATRRLFITGASGTGKSTLVHELVHLGISALDIDVVDGLASWRHRVTGVPSDWAPGASAQWHRDHHWVIDRARMCDLLQAEQPQVMAGLASNQTDIVDLFDVSVLLQCPEEVFLQRIRDRPENRYGKHESERRVILATRAAMEQQMLDAGAVAVQTDRPLADVVATVRRLL